MNFQSVIHVLGALSFFFGLFMIFPTGISLYYNETDFDPLAFSTLITVVLGFVIWKITRLTSDLRTREGFAIVTLGWIVMSAFGALPFWISGEIHTYTDAYFETISGLTTTGATILTEIEDLPHGLLFWRSLMHWLGGMGIIVMSLAILPMLGVGGMQLFKAEVPGPVAEKVAPRVQQTAKILWGVYVLISVVETILLMIGGMTLFDALCHTFGTMATGGFSTKNASVGQYNSAYFDYVITFFMFVAGINFALHYHVLKGNIKAYVKNKEFLFYLGIILIFTFIITIDVRINNYDSISEAFRKSIFQVVAITTTTGFSTADYELWSPMSQMIIFSLMFVGGCAGSTGGSIKIVRILLLLKHGIVEVRKSIHPKAVMLVRLGGRVIPNEIITNILGFFLFYMFIFITASVFMAFLGLDFISALGSVAATLGNIGPGLGSVGPTDNYAHIPDIGKWLLSFLMLIGRLEIYTVLVLFSRTFWRQ